MKRNGAFIAVFVPFLFAMAVLFACFLALDMRACHNYQRLSGVETKFTIASCYIKQEDGTFLPYSEHKARVTASERK